MLFSRVLLRELLHEVMASICWYMDSGIKKSGIKKSGIKKELFEGY